MCMYTYYINYEYIYMEEWEGHTVFSRQSYHVFFSFVFLLTEKHLPEIMHYLNQIGVFTDHSQLIHF